MTANTRDLERVYATQGGRAALPLKWFTIGQCWRYERTTRGRRREHYQWCVTTARPDLRRGTALLLRVCRAVDVASSDVCKAGSVAVETNWQS